MSQTVEPNYIKIARQWIEWDVNAETKANVQELIDTNDEVSLQKMFGNRLAFGTAGLRGPMGPGTNAMNDIIVIQTTQGLCEYLNVTLSAGFKTMGIAIGYDHRRQGSLNSKRFAELTTAVVVSYGCKVFFYDEFVPTPLIPFLLEQKRCAAGIMITASHNPKKDNGYKLYGPNGCQIISPQDTLISAYIERNQMPWQNYSDEFVRSSIYEATSGLVEFPLKEMTDRYFTRMQEKLCRFPADNSSTEAKFVYTSMHGVGHPFLTRAFRAFQLPAYIPVQDQILPHPDFPTVDFPNPEEGKGSLFLAMKTGEENAANLILANDPDADRLAVAECDRKSLEWTIFTGNEIGLLFGHWEMTQHLERNPSMDRSKLYFVASTVSSKMLGAVASAHSAQFAETLSGFKWIGNKVDELRQSGHTVLFSFEEAIGFCVGDLVKDKDGISAAVVFAEMAVQLYKRKTTVKAFLKDLYDQYGHFISYNHYVRCDDPIKVRAIFERLRNDGQYMKTCGGFSIQYVRDMTKGIDTSQPNGRALLPTTPSTQMITFSFTNGCTATLRTSGTEPKIKFYVEIAGKPHECRSELKQTLLKLVDEIIGQMLRPTENGLEKPSRLDIS
uniref:Phosphoglucomutase putative n=1 Tax=Albugo laibachii Nc14 TaxID=890382 RepID=F0W6A1_9STRA|nr:phosphoglucomutase putative [Albugo laibachii Nc14]|eukprot:CCA16644.1 phosphoglucomutase putative [Albugo laibachii Nc14]